MYKLQFFLHLSLVTLYMTRIRKAACNETNAYLRRLLYWLSISPVDPATNTDGIVIPCLSTINGNSLHLIMTTNYCILSLFYYIQYKCESVKYQL